jgi:hypothetical protein
MAGKNYNNAKVVKSSSKGSTSVNAKTFGQKLSDNNTNSSGKSNSTYVRNQPK